jgi:hypothetical protein
MGHRSLDARKGEPKRRQNDIRAEGLEGSTGISGTMPAGICGCWQLERGAKERLKQGRLGSFCQHIRALVEARQPSQKKCSSPIVPKALQRIESRAVAIE